MKQSRYTLTPKRGNHLIGMFIFGAVSIGALFIIPPEVSPFISGFSGIFFLVHLFLVLKPSSVGADISSIADNIQPRSPKDRLISLSELHSQGLISDDELSQRRRAILDTI